MSWPAPSPRDVGVIVVAAGRGSRVGGGAPKQFREIAGAPMLLRALRPFLRHPEVDLVTAVLPADQVGSPPAWLGELAGDRLRLVAGGVERVDSVRAGLAALPPSVRRVLVHDGARPFPATEVIDAILAVVARGESAIAAVPLTDTVKETERTADGALVVRRTIPRDTLWRAQTPQGFPRALLEEAHARHDGTPVSDDAALIERFGGRLHIVPDSALNLKVTTPEDFVLAEAIAAGAR
ncbi:MAG TPA: 2-C-methyl-D-erythritol 4-phosphate cytidylyltransferase [Gemmatimonadales bacterium]|jgi:2-C-methyl-D-erythritol 4-phosphate cytidylyltransferase